MSDRAARAKVRSADPAFEPARSGGYSPPQSSDRLAGAAGSHPDAPAISAMDDVDKARMEEYALLAALLRQAPDGVLLKGLSGIRGDGTPLGVAHAALAGAAEETDPERLEREFFDLFLGVGRGELLPYGSYYLTGFLNERPLARLREDLRLLGVSRTEDQVEPEDHAAILCEIMAGLAGGTLAAAPNVQKRFFEKHLAPWIGRFFTDLEQVKDSNFYRRVGTVGRLFVEIETEAFALPS
jgi:TorA maturation chaperone TorD